MIADDASFIRRFTDLAGRAPDRLFARFDGVPLSFERLHRSSDALAAGLRGLGLASGERVAVMLPNSPEAIAVVFALAKAGLVWVPVNVHQRGDGLRYVLDHSGCRLVIAAAGVVPAIRACGASGADLAVLGDAEAPLRVEDLLAGPATFDDPPPAADALLSIAYTSGTTGPPKGVLVSHRMLAFAGEGVLLASAAADGDVMFLWEPLYHIGGAQLLVVPLLREVELAMVGRFSASRFWSEAQAAGASHIHYLGGVLQLLLKQPPGPQDRAHGVRVAWGGGCPRPIWTEFEERFRVAIRECYGMTEASSITTCNDRGPVGSVGRAVPWLEVEITDQQGSPLGPGERGEIVVRQRRPGALFAGYWDDPAASAAALRDGALHTGDLGSIDAAGNLTFHGRMTDSVRCGGENVSAWEVEHVAAGHPQIEACAMVGVPSDLGEQDIKLFVKPRRGQSIDVAQLAAWLAEHLAPYQTPRYIALVEAFPETPSQRIMKHELSRETTGCFDRQAARCAR